MDKPIPNYPENCLLLSSEISSSDQSICAMCLQKGCCEYEDYISSLPICNNFVFKHHFSFNEFFIHCTTQERLLAIQKPDVVSNLLKLVNILEHVRDDLTNIAWVDVPIYINSCYRDKSHNAREGGSPTSQHLNASAVDIRCSRMDDLYHILKEHYRPFGQLIRYDSFIHYSLPTSTHINHILDYRTK